MSNFFSESQFPSYVSHPYCKFSSILLSFLSYVLNYFLYSSACLFSWSHLLRLEVVLTFFFDWHFYISVPLDLVMKSLWSLRGVMSYLLIFLLFLCCNLPICLNISGLFNYYFSEWSPMWLIEKKTDLFGLRLLVLLLLFPPPHCPSVYPHFQLTYPPFVISSSLPIIPSWRQRLSISSPWLCSSIVQHRGCFCFTIFRYQP